MNTQQSDKRRRIMVIVMCVLILCGISYFHWQGMSIDVPSRSELASVEANAFRRDHGRESIEFTDPQGHRYQARNLSHGEQEEIRTAIAEKIPVRLLYGRWLTPIASSKISTVYSIEIGDKVLIPYERAVESKAREKNSRVLVMALAIPVSLLALFVGLKAGARIRTPSSGQTRSPRLFG